MEEKLHEVNGKKFIIKPDPTMTHVEEYRIGDQVMVMKKKYSDYQMYPGVIIGFYEFNAMPTIHVAYLDVDYSAAKVEFIAFNANTKEAEFCKYTGNDLPYGKDRVLTLLAQEIQKKEEELNGLRHKRDYFVECFGRYFTADTEVAS